MIDERLESGSTAADEPGVDLEDPAQKVRTLRTLSPPGEQKKRRIQVAHIQSVTLPAVHCLSTA